LDDGMRTGQRRILGSASLHHACNDASTVVLPTIFPILYTQGLLISSYSDIGTTILVGLVTAVIFQAFVGHVARTRHSRYYLALDALVVGISLLLMTRANTYWMLVLFFIGVRVGTSIYHPVGISWISHTFVGSELDRAMGFQSAFGNIGVLLAFTSTGFLAERFGWQAPLYLWGLINLSAVVVGLYLSRNAYEPGEIERQKADEKEPVSWTGAFAGIRTFVPMMVLGGLAWGVTVNYAPSLLNHRLGLPMSATGIVMGCWMCAGTLSAFSYGRISATLGRARTLVYAYLTIAAISLIFGFGRSVPLTIAAFAVFGVALFATYPANLSFIGSSVAPRNRTAAFSLASNMMIVGNSIFSYISGRISDRFGINAPFLLLGAVTAIVLIYLAAMVRSGRIAADGCRIAGRGETA
jgi:FSR family fosmidomycin resistance protein-like MFS transporter